MRGYLVFGFSDRFLTPAIYLRPVGAVRKPHRIWIKNPYIDFSVGFGAVRKPPNQRYECYIAFPAYRPGVLTLSKSQ